MYVYIQICILLVFLLDSYYKFVHMVCKKVIKCFSWIILLLFYVCASLQDESDVSPSVTNESSQSGINTVSSS